MERADVEGEPMQRAVLRNGRLAALTAISLCFLCRTARATTVYVTMSGNDAAAGTASSPWRTIQHGVEALQPGDTLLIGPGTYRERIEIQRGGTAQAPVTLAAMPGARVIVSGADRLRSGWSKVAGAEDGIYVHAWTYRFPIGGPNDLTHPG